MWTVGCHVEEMLRECFIDECLIFQHTVSPAVRKTTTTNPRRSGKR